MNKFIYKTSTASLLILIFLVSVNYWGDAARIFHPDYEKKIADIIFSNKNATNIANYDDRILQKELTDKLVSSPDILVIGSSRTMLINSTYFKDKKVINNSVNSASIPDLIAIFQLYKIKNILPKKIILGVDPWMFNIHSTSTKWQSLREEYYNFTSENKEKREIITHNSAEQLFSLSYFQASLKNLPNVINGNSDPIPTDQIYNESNTKLMDGSLSYGKKYRESSNKQINLSVRAYISPEIPRIHNFNDISSQRIQEFKQLCNAIINDNIDLSFFLSPFHPIAFEKIKQDYKTVLEVESKLSEFAKEKNIEFLGSYNPTKIGIDNNGFYDANHSKESTIEKILNIKTKNSSYKSLANW
jgi:hypothetical protein